MADDQFFREFMRGVYYQVPYLIAYCIGVFFALSYWRRFPLPSTFTFLACAMKITAALAFPLSAALLLRRGDFRTFETVTVLTAIFDASAYGLLLLAVFSSRAVLRPPPFDWPDELDPDAPKPPTPPLAPPADAPPAAPPSSQGTGIQERR